MPNISLCMIVKNEEEVLARALRDWRSLADELIIVDTGSTDATVRIAEEHGAQVLHYAWEYPGNKGEARNVGIDAAQGDWIVVLDADEMIRECWELRHFLLNPPTDFDAVQVLFENYPDGALTLKWYQVRAFRRGRYRYIHREHEMPHWCGDSEEKQVMLDVVFEHRPPGGREPAKMQSMLDRLHLDVQEHPDDPTPLYFLHRQYVLAGEWQLGIDWGIKYLMLRTGDPCEAYGNLATCFYSLGDANEAVRWLCRALAEQPHRRIWWIRLAEVYLSASMHHYALAYLRGASTLPPTWEGQWEPATYTMQLETMISQCEEAING